MPEDKHLQELWKSQDTKDFHMTLDEIHTRANKFQSTVRWRNITEYIVGGLVALVFASMAVLIPEPIVRAGCVLIVLGTLYVVWQLHKQASAQSLGAHETAMSLADFHLTELRRQRDALSTVWRWYLAPFIPGMLVFMFGVTFSADNPSPWAAKLGTLAIGLVIVAAIDVGIWMLNRSAARKLTEEIEALEAEQ